MDFLKPILSMNSKEQFSGPVYRNYECLKSGKLVIDLTGPLKNILSKKNQWPDKSSLI